jgi:hypothetical protein
LVGIGYHGSDGID